MPSDGDQDRRINNQLGGQPVTVVPENLLGGPIVEYGKPGETLLNLGDRFAVYIAARAPAFAFQLGLQRVLDRRGNLPAPQTRQLTGKARGLRVLDVQSGRLARDRR